MKKLVIFTLILVLPSFVSAQTVDSDNDGLTDNQESEIYFTDPLNPDSDGDGFLDGEEVENGYSPRHGDNLKLDQVDSDQDYLIDAWEIALGTGLLNPDSDADKYLDGTEVAAGYDPLNSEPVLLPKEIHVDITTQELYYTFGGVELDRFLVSTGIGNWITPEGEFEVLDKVPVKRYVGPGYDLPNTKWNLQFTTYKGWRYWIHGAYWHNNFGNPMSHGCVNVHYDNMENLYWFAQHGTKVVIARS